MSGCCNNFCGSNRNNTYIIAAAIIALILINCLDDECATTWGAFFQMLGDAMALGMTAGCRCTCRGNEIKNSYF